MEFKFTEQQERFRQEVRAFLEEELRLGGFTPSLDGRIASYSPEFTRKLANKHWIGLTWPKEYGGQARPYLDRLILTEELLRCGAPTACHWFADRQIGAAVLAFGTEEQKREILPGIIRGEAYFGVLISEPEAGSDAASVRTRAIPDGDSYIIDGQKVWTSGAQHMNHFYLLARTDTQVPKHKGISEFILEANLPGITVRPLRDMTGGDHFNEVFFDNVRIPRKCLLGKENRGFYQVVEQLAYERSGIERIMDNYPLFAGLTKFCRETRRNGRPLSEDAIIRNKLAQLQIEFEIGRLLIYRVATVMDQGRAPASEAAMAKAYCTAFEQRLASTAVEILGPYGQLLAESRYSPLAGMAPYSYLWAFGYTIQGGTSEVLKNIIAERGLGLPAE